MYLKKQNGIDGNKILSRNTEYKKKILKAFQKIVAVFKINSIDFGFYCVCWSEHNNSF